MYGILHEKKLKININYINKLSRWEIVFTGFFFFPDGIPGGIPIFVTMPGFIGLRL